ncbi:MAG TPA: hypothetical protein VFB49_00070 [Patescibacteria group bacterium]|nr:hypothetical protein [Patescibacteria group bacterium]
MDRDRVTLFGGTTGRVLCDAMSLGTAVTGLVLGIAIVAESFVLGFVGARMLSQVVAQVIFAIVLARFTLNGMSGESRGSIFSSAGGSWFLALAVAGRYLVLNAIWTIPLAFVAWQSIGAALGGGASASGAAGMQSGAGATVVWPIFALLLSKQLWASVGLLVFGMALLPPVFLIVSVRSESFADIFSPPHWQATFSGRGGDLYSIYATYAGGLGMMIVLSIPVVLLGFATAPGFGYFFVFLAFAFAMGLAVTLLGRLCGFFAFGDTAGGPANVGGFAPDSPEAPAPRRFAGSNVVPHPALATAGGVSADAPHAADAEPPVAEAADDSGLPPLPDAAERVAGAMKRFETDPAGAIGELDELRGAHAPSPLVLHARTLCLLRAGRADEAVAAAREAMPLCLARGSVALAAEIFAALWKRAKELGLEREQIDVIGAALYKSGDLARSASAYGMALTMDRGDRKAIKGLMQIADQRMHREGRPKDAARIYTFLLQYAPNTPFAEDMKQGLAEAEARAARTGT